MDGRPYALGLVEMVDWNINFGNLLTIGFVVGGFAASQLLTNRDVKDIKAQMKAVASLITGHAVFENRLDHLEEDIRSVKTTVEELRHGEGFIRGGGRRGGIDGEYP